MPSFRGRLRAPKITFSKLGQIVYTIRRVFILMMEVSPRLFLLYTVLSIFSTLLSFPSLWVGKLLLDTLVEGIRNQSIDLLPRLGFFIGLSVSLNLFSIILERIENFLDRILSQKFESKLVVKIGRKLAELDLATIEDPKFQNKYKKIEQEATRRAYALLSPTVDIIASGLALISAISILFFVSPLIAVGIILFSLPRVFSNSYFIRKRYEFVTEASPIRRVIGWLNYYLVRNINFMELKILNLTGYFSLRQDTLQDDLLRRETSLRKRWEISNTLSFLPLLIFDGICEFWLGVRAIYGIITLGSFQFYSSTLQRAQGNFRSLVSSIMDVYEHYLYVSDLTWFLSLVPKIDNLSGIDVGLVQQPSIQFKNVWFRYKKSSSWILKNMNFSIAPGENIAIVGVNGSGKSTLIKLLSRFYDPQRGGVYMNELNLSEVQPVAWRQNLAVLFQEFESYPFTARESISYGDVSRLHDTDAVKMAAKLTLL
jgi:ATP-binding cassette subfamily B protein